jgi:poly(3-hydroxyoctanoate) depolymerase
MTRERSLRIGGVRLHVREVGDGPPVLLINGLGTHTAMWAPLERALAEFHLIEFDSPAPDSRPRRPTRSPSQRSLG